MGLALVPETGKAQVVLSESFNDATLPAGWTQEYVSGTLNWATVTANQNSTITPHSGARMAEFRNTTQGSATKLITPSMDLSAVPNPTLTFYYANVNWLGDIDELRVFYKTSVGGAWTQIGSDYTAEKTTWEQVVLALPNPSSDYYVAFEATSNYARGLDLDDVTIEGVSPCSGTPTPGNTTGPASVAAGGTANLGLQNATSGTGVDYQWYVSTTSGSGPWTPVGPNAATYSPTVSVDSWFYCDVTCTEPGGGTGSSNVLAVQALAVTLVPQTGNNTVPCGTDFILRDNGGTGNYANSSSGYTVIEAGTGATINIAGSYNMESGYDFIRIYDGVGTGGTLLATYTGSGTANYTGTTGQTLTVQLSADGTVNFSGFEFTVTFAGTCYAACSGVPNNGTASGPATVCSGSTAALSATGLTAASGISYQWEESPDGLIGWNNVVGGSGATTPNYTTTAVNATRYFRIRTICTTGPDTAWSNVVTVGTTGAVTPAVYDGISYTESFESWVDGCGTTDRPSASWNNDPYTGYNSWRRNDQGSSAAWSSSSGMYTPASSNGTYSARFHTWDATSGTKGILDLHIDMSAGSGTDNMVFDVINTSGTDLLKVFESSDGGATFTQLGANIGVVSSWTGQSRTITSTAANTVIRFEATSDWGTTDIGLDNLRILPCTPATAGSQTIVPACGTGEYYIDVDLTSLGSSTTIDLTNSLNGNVVTANATGVWQVGPFPSGTAVTVTLEHNNAACNSTLATQNYYCPPANDECAGAVALTVNPDYTCGSVTSGTVASATASAGATGCSGTADDDVWYSFTATGAAHRVSLTNIVGSTTDMYMAFYSGSCGALTNIHCSDPNEANLTGLTAGQTYYVRVYTWTSTPGQTSTFDICVGTPPPPPANDECAGAVALTVNPDYACGSVTSGTVASATASAGATGCSGTADDDVWYSFTATGAAHRVSLTNIVGSTTDMYMAFYSGSCGALTNIHCSDPNEANLTGLTAGQTYYVRVYTYTSTPGQTSTFDICVGTPPPPPTCPGGLGPNTVNIASLPYSTTGQTTCGSGNNITSSNVGVTCGSTSYYGGEDRTYIFTATETGVYNIDLTTGADQDAGMTVFHGCPFDPASTCMGSAQSLSGLTRSLAPSLIAGETYYVVVDNWPSPSCLTSFDLSITAPPPCLGNQVVVDINTDAWPGETSWEIVDAGNNVIASGAPSTANALNSTVACLGNTPGPAWYGFRITDSSSDGIIGGGWELRTTGGKLIMGDEFSDGASSPVNPPLYGGYGNYHSFALPLAAPDVHPAECGVFDNRSDNKVFANKVAGTNYLGGTLNYQFEFSDPDSGYIRRIKKPRNYIVFSELNPSPLKGGKHYFTRVRTDKAGPVADAHWGAGCEMGLGTTVNCTQLIEAPTYGHSCNETRRYGPSSFIYAQPVFGASQYEFRIFNTGEGYDETYVRNTYILELNGFANPLVDGYSYQVQVRAKVSDTWGSYCGTCSITIDNQQQMLDQHLVQAAGEATLWPNPARDGQVYLNIDGIEAATQQITVDVKDIYGQQVYGQAFGNSGERFSTVLNLPGDIASGVYLVNITVNGEVTTKRLSVVR